MRKLAIKSSFKVPLLVFFPIFLSYHGVSLKHSITLKWSQKEVLLRRSIFEYNMYNTDKTSSQIFFGFFAKTNVLNLRRRRENSPRPRKPGPGGISGRSPQSRQRRRSVQLFSHVLTSKLTYLVEINNTVKKKTSSCYSLFSLTVFHSVSILFDYFTPVLINS